MLPLPFLQETAPCLPMSKPHLAHLLGFFVSAVLLETGRRSYDWWPCSPPHFCSCLCMYLLSRRSQFHLNLDTVTRCICSAM
ncbi:hypothetical protein BC835DRAFT_1343083, partial [Cytidiella melzeri]